MKRSISAPLESIFVLAGLVLPAFVLALVFASPSWAQPSTQPRIQAADVTYAGTVTLPTGIGNPNSIAVSADGLTMYIGCYGASFNTGIATVTIPSLGGTAVLVSGCSTLPNLNLVHMNCNFNNCPPATAYLDIIPSGIIPYGGRIIVSGTAYYDGSSGQYQSMWYGSSTSHTGPVPVVVTDVGQWTDSVTRYKQSFVSGFSGMIPTEWRTLFGGPALAGGCCFPIIFGRSLGPSASVFDPDNVGVVSPVPAKMIVGYPYEHSTLGRWEDSPPASSVTVPGGPYYGGSNQMGSVGFPSGTRSVLFTGRNSNTMCYGPGTSNPALVGTINPAVSAYPYCLDIFDTGQGNHGYSATAADSYRPTMWAYDANDLLRVKTGELKPWEVFPYAKWDLPGLPITAPYYLRAGWFDEATNRYYVGDTSTNVIHVFDIAIGTNPIPVNCVETAGLWGPGAQPLGWSAWTFLNATQESRYRTRTWTQTVAAANGGTACTFTTGGLNSTAPETVTEIRTTQTSFGVVVSGATVTCTLDVEAFEVPPGTGWVVQFSRRLIDGVTAPWTDHGTPVTTSPYQMSRQVALGNYEVRAIWSKVASTDVPAVTTYPAWACVP